MSRANNLGPIGTFLVDRGLPVAAAWQFEETLRKLRATDRPLLVGLLKSQDANDIEPADDIDETGVAHVESLIAKVREAGLAEPADMFSTVYWAWLRTTSAYRFALPLVEEPDEPGMTPYSALHVTTYTIKIWAPQIPGSPTIDNEAVRKFYAADDAWHREEDRRMRRAAGEPV